MAKLANRAKMTISSTGTGNITLASAVAGYQTFLDSGISDGDQVRYIVEQGTDWEIGTAAVSNNSTVLVRTVEESSAANNAALDLTSSAKVFIAVTAKDLDNAAPLFASSLPTALRLRKDGTSAINLDAKAYDEQGFPIQYSWDALGGSTVYDASSLPPQFASAPSINQSTGVFSLIGTTNTSNAGSVNFRVKASDGVKVATATTLIDHSFLPPVTSGLLGYYDVEDPSSYSGSGTAWSDVSGNSGPNLTINSNVTYNASGIGSRPSFSYSGVSDFSYSGSAFSTTSSSAAIFALYQATEPSPASIQIWFANGTGADNYGFYTIAGGTGTTISDYSGARLTSTLATGNSAIYINKIDSTQATQDTAASRLYSSALASVVVQTCNLDAGFAFPTDRSGSWGTTGTGQLKLLAIYNRSLTAAEIEQLHAWAKISYASNSDMHA